MENRKPCCVNSFEFFDHTGSSARPRVPSPFYAPDQIVVTRRSSNAAKRYEWSLW